MPRPIEVPLPRERSCAAIARRLVERHFSYELDAHAIENLKLVATELVDNAYLHGEGEIQLRLQKLGPCVRVEVIDEGQDAEIRVRPNPTGVGGHGLQLVQRLASAWGAREGTAHVWAELWVAR